MAAYWIVKTNENTLSLTCPTFFGKMEAVQVKQLRSGQFQYKWRHGTTVRVRIPQCMSKEVLQFVEWADNQDDPQKAIQELLAIAQAK